MDNPEDATWYELRPNGHPSVGVWNPQRFADREAAEAAARTMRERSPDFRFVEIVICTLRGGDRSRPTPVARV
jgi:hypothetical protein